MAKCRTLNEKILHKEIFIYDEEFKIYKEIMPGFRKVSKSVLDYLVIIKLLVEKGIEDTTEGKAYVNRMIKGKDGVVNKDFVQEKNPKMPWTTSFP